MLKTFALHIRRYDNGRRFTPILKETLQEAIAEARAMLGADDEIDLIEIYPISGPVVEVTRPRPAAPGLADAPK